MFDELLEVTREFLKKLITSRLFALAVIFTLMFTGLICKLFRMQILDGSSYQESYMQRTEKLVTTPGTRGNIYDHNGNLLAYNQLAYAVAIQDLGDYPKAVDRNAMIYRLVSILERRGEKIDGKFEIALDENGQMYFTSTSNAAKKRFLLNFYGISSQQLDDDTGKYPSDITAREAFELKKGATRQGYKLTDMKDTDGNPVELSDQTALDMINIIYTMELTRFQKYESTTVATNISQETMTEINENAADLKGVSIEPSSIRVYNDSLYFAPIIGYTGKVQEDQIHNLNENWRASQNTASSESADEVEKYDLNDIVGRIGIEKSMELELQGEKGYTRMYVDNMGRPREIIEQQDAQAGNDIYLTIDRDLQIAVYNLLEQEIAGIVYSNIDNPGSDINIPITDVYFALINNNVIDFSHFSEENASSTEREVQQIFASRQNAVIEQIRTELTGSAPTPFASMTEEYQDYFTYIIKNMLHDNNILLKKNIDTSDEVYLQWQNGAIGPQEYLNHAIAKGWIDITKFSVSEKYSDSTEIYDALCDYILNDISTDSDFTKIIYEYLIQTDAITGRQLCLILFDQNILAFDEDDIAGLSGGTIAPASFIKEKIQNLEITPAQLALDPCAGSCVITDTKTGEVLALVSYPGYDGNRLANTVDSDYFNSLQQNNARPLYNYATQQRTAPGSTFKMVSATAGLAEHVISTTEQIQDLGVYKNVSNEPECWIYRSSHGSHGLINVSEALRDSCNYFFYEVGYRLSTNNYAMSYNNDAAENGIEKIQKYASLYGLNETTGVEIEESKPQVADSFPVMAAIGQSNNNYSTIQLARYVTAVANGGTVYNYTLLNKVTDSDGNTLKQYEPEIRNTVDVLSDSDWDAIHTGMRMVVENTKEFDGFPIEAAGKTGTAQEDLKRPNHALFVGYAPYDNPEISIATRIANGYTSHNAAEVSKKILAYYFKVEDADSLLNGQAENINATSNGVND